MTFVFVGKFKERLSLSWLISPKDSSGIPTRNLFSSYLWLWHLQPRSRVTSTWQ